MKKQGLCGILIILLMVLTASCGALHGSNAEQLSGISYTPVALDYTPGAVSDNATVSIPEALFRKYRQYYAEIFAGVMGEKA